MKLGDKILNLRKKKGLSQEQLGEKINVTRQTISNWELGETSPNPEQLKLLSKELNVSIDELLDNNIENVLIEKVSNTEELTKLILKVIKMFIMAVIGTILLLLILAITFKIIKKSQYTGRRLEDSIHCKIYGEEHSLSIEYQELTGQVLVIGGDTYFTDILDLDKYNDAHKIFNIINDYVKKNNGTCEIIEDKNLNDIVDMTVKEGTLTKSGATVVIKETKDYDITYGYPFWIEKYNSTLGDFEKLEETKEGCAFILPAFGVTPDKPLELEQGWSCMYGELDKGLYRLVKNVSFESDNPITKDKEYYIWTEFEIK